MTKIYILLLFFITFLSCKTSTGYLSDIRHSIPQGYVVSKVIDVKIDGVDLTKLDDSLKIVNEQLKALSDSISKVRKQAERDYDSMVLIGKGENLNLRVYEYPFHEIYLQVHYPEILKEKLGEREVYMKYSTPEMSLPRYINDNLRYPEIMREERVEGEVFVEFVIDKEGEVKNMSFTNSIHSAAETEIFRIISKLKWIPAKLNNRPEESTMRVAICFYLVD